MDEARETSDCEETDGSEARPHLQMPFLRVDSKGFRAVGPDGFLHETARHPGGIQHVPAVTTATELCHRLFPAGCASGSSACRHDPPKISAVWRPCWPHCSLCSGPCRTRTPSATVLSCRSAPLTHGAWQPPALGEPVAWRYVGLHTLRVGRAERQ